MHVAYLLDVGFVDELVESIKSNNRNGNVGSLLEMKRIAELLSAVGKLKSYVSKRLHLSG